MRGDLFARAGYRIYPYQLGAIVREATTIETTVKTYGLGEFVQNDYVMVCSSTAYGDVNLYIPNTSKITRITSDPSAATDDEVTVSVARLFFGYATGTNLWFPFAVGATVALFPERPTPENLIRVIERYRPTIVTNVPTMLAKLLDHDDERRARGEAPLDLACVRFHLSAGEALPPTLLERFSRTR